MKVLYARTTIDSDRDQVKKLEIGYSDDVSVFLNGQILYRGRSAQGFRDPGFLGIVNPENDAVYLPLKKGSNELVLAVSELGGGWGFICRLVECRTETGDRHDSIRPSRELPIMTRRETIRLLGSAAGAWSAVAPSSASR